MGIIWGALSIFNWQEPVGAAELWAHSLILGVLHRARVLQGCSSLAGPCLPPAAEPMSLPGPRGFWLIVCLSLLISVQQAFVEFLLHLAKHVLDPRSTDMFERWALLSLLGTQSLSCQSLLCDKVSGGGMDQIQG